MTPDSPVEVLLQPFYAAVVDRRNHVVAMLLTENMAWRYIERTRLTGSTVRRVYITGHTTLTTEERN